MKISILFILAICAQTLAYADSAREIMGYSIISNDDGSVIRLECVRESPVQGECAEVQFVHQNGLLRDPLSGPIEVSKLNEFYATLSEKLQQEIQSSTTELGHMTVMPVSKVMYDSRNIGWATGLLGGSVGAVIASFTLTGLPVFAISGVIFFWPVVTDVVILPFRGAAHGVAAIAVRIKNRRMRKHFLRIQKEMMALIQEGNRSIKLNGSDFNALLEMYKPAVQVSK